MFKWRCVVNGLYGLSVVMVGEVNGALGHSTLLCTASGLGNQAKAELLNMAAIGPFRHKLQVFVYTIRAFKVGKTQHTLHEIAKTLITPSFSFLIVLPTA